MTPAALRIDVLDGRSRSASSTVYLDRTDPDAEERLRSVLWQRFPGAFVAVVNGRVESSQFADVRPALFAGATLTITLVGVACSSRCSTSCGSGGGCSPASSPSVPGAAPWAGRSCGRRLCRWGSACCSPSPRGSGVGTVLLRIVSQPVVIGRPIVGLVLDVAALVVLAVTALSLPVLFRLMRAGGLRTE